MKKMIKVFFVLEKSDREWNENMNIKTRHNLFGTNTPFHLDAFGPNHLANILHPYLLAYSKLCETSEMKSFARMVMRKNSIPVVNL